LLAFKASLFFSLWTHSCFGRKKQRQKK